MTYLLQVSTCWILFYAIYLLFLRKETFFNINRYYLLSALLVGLAVPYLGSMLPSNEASVQVYQVMTTFSEVETVSYAVTPQVESFDWMIVLWSLYIVGALVVLSRFVYGLSRIYAIYAGADRVRYPKYTLVESDKYHLPFSFFHYIFISKRLPLNEEVEKVLKHEELHANQWHSVDIIFTEMLQVFFWFNPVIIFYKQALRQSHEYLADAYVTQDHNKNSYGQLLLQQSTSGMEIALANQFFHSQIKKRITMMYTEKSKRSAMIKYLAAVPVLVAMLLIFSSSKMGDDYNPEALRAEFSELYEEVAFSELTMLDHQIKWDNLLNKYITTSNSNEVSQEFKSVASEYGINLEINHNSYGGQFTFSNFHYVVPPHKLQEWRKDTEKKSPYNKIFDYDNFGGRKIVSRNWPNLWFKYKAFEGLISIKCEANENGDIFHTEIIGEETTIKNDIIISDALEQAKGFKIEKGKGNVTGKLSFGLGMTGVGQGQVFKSEKDAFKYDSEINVGQLVPEGSAEVKVNDQLLTENIDYSINYQTGKMTMSDSYDGEYPVKVTFKDQSDPIFKVVEEMPRFPGCEEMKGTANEKEQCGKEKMLQFIYGNIKYPAIARNENIEGMTVIQFIVEKDGSITNAKTVREIGGGCGAESKRVVESMPKWIPGKQKGKVVRVQYTLPVKYKLADDKKVDMPVVVGYGTANEANKRDNITQIKPSARYSDGSVYKVVQEMPRFLGCEDMSGSTKEKEQCARQKMLEFIYKNLRYPADARKKGIEGMAVVQFIVNKDGTISDATIVRDPGKGTGTEAKRVVGIMGKWIPGKQNGKAVDVAYTLPVKYKLQGNDEEQVEIKSSLEYTTAEFKKIKNVSDILSDAGFESEEIENLVGFNFVRVAKGEDAYVGKSKDGATTEFHKELIQKAKKNNRYFIEEIKFKKAGTIENAGALSIKIVENKAEGMLKGKKAGIDITEGGNTKIVIGPGKSSGPDPLYVIDGKIKDGKLVQDIDPDKIKSINVIKGEKAQEKYGDKGADGVIEISMKGASNRKEYLIEGQLYDESFYQSIDKSHIKNERSATKEEKFMRNITGDLTVVSMKLGYGYNSAYFPGTNTEDGSQRALLDFVFSNVKYPKSAIDNNVEGMVVLRFTVEADGSIEKINVVKSPGWGLDEAVLTMMEEMMEQKGNWTAAYIDRRAVVSQITLPVKFKLQDNQKEEVKSRRLKIDRLDISPNPTDGIFNLAFELEDKTPVDIQFYSINGQLIKEINDAPSTYKNSIDLSDQNGQTILVNIIQNGKIHTNKVIIR